MEYTDKFKKAYKKLTDGLDNIRKQMILVEICKDLREIQKIVKGLLKYDSTNKNQRDNQANNKRQHFRKQFSSHIMQGIKERYAHQMYLFYKGDEAMFGKDLSNGLTVKMKRDAHSYGIQARTLLLKIVAIMIENGVELTLDSFQNPSPNLKSSGILGWLMQLSQYPQIAENLSKLSNLMIE